MQPTTLLFLIRLIVRARDCQSESLVSIRRDTIGGSNVAGLRVWVNGRLGKTPQVVPRFNGSANRRVDLHLPLIASILCPRRGAMATLADRRRRGEKSGQSLLFSTKRPFSTGEKGVLYKPTLAATHVSHVPESKWSLPLPSQPSGRWPNVKNTDQISSTRYW